ncbi:MAG: hypothetical protein D6B27_03390 [Gammaproteobacteria bacterium]|nr:MAG: hypothetical protein D6B27_03390 [Gammaproteobacteria bacterium]
MSNILAFQKIVNSNYILAAIDSTEGERIRELLLGFSVKMGRALYYWAPDNGLYRLGMNHIRIPRTETPFRALSYIENSNNYGIYLIEDHQMFLNKEAINTELLKIAAKEDRVKRLIIFIGENIEIPQLLSPIFLRIRHGTKPTEQTTNKNVRLVV